MDFKMRFDEGADAFLPGVHSRNSGVDVNDGGICVRLGKELETEVDLGSIAQVRAIPNPEPEVMLPLGISAAVQQFGPDTLGALSSREGLVRLDFNRTVEARTLTAAAASGEAPKPDQATLGVQHLVVSLEDPEGFVDELQRRMNEARTLQTADR